MLVLGEGWGEGRLGRGDATDHSLYCSFHWAFHPSGTFGGGGPGGASKSAIFFTLCPFVRSLSTPHSYLGVL